MLLHVHQESEVDTYLRETKRAYDLVAPRFAETNRALPEDLQAAAEEFVERLPAGAKILDAGCGAGRDAAWFQHAGLRVTGVDTSEAMLAIARKESEASFRRMDVQRMKFRDGVFAGVWSSALLVHLPPDRARLALREFWRVLKPGGICFISTKAGRGFRWDEVTYAPERRFMQLYTAAALKKLLSEANFRAIQMEPSKQWVRVFCEKPE